MNNADPDCGTTFTWASRAFGPKTGWAGGWGIIAADVLVMASLAQIAGQYVFLLFNANGIGTDPSSGWVLLVGILWIVAMTAICYVGIEVSANFQKALLGIELTMLVVLSVVALVKVGNGSAPIGHLTPTWSWFNPFDVPSASSFINGVLLMLFIYWGWDTTVSVNEETADPATVPGQAAVLSTFVLLGHLRLGHPVRPDLRRHRDQGDRARQPQQPGRRPVRAGPLGVRYFGIRQLPLPSPVAHGAELGRRLDPDDHPADGPHHAGHERVQGDPLDVLTHPQAVPDPDRLDGGDGSWSRSSST